MGLRRGIQAGDRPPGHGTRPGTRIAGPGAAGQAGRAALQAGLANGGQPAGTAGGNQGKCLA
jgi:hypothetical protein